jgi:aminotransferase
MRHISERESELPEAVIGRLLEIAVEHKEIISLGPGEPDFAAPKPITDYTKQIADRCNHYSPPGGRRELKEAIIKKLHKENGIECNPDNIVVTTGSQEALLLGIAAALDVSEQVIIPNPSFFGYLSTSEILTVQPVPLPLREKNKWIIDPDDLKKVADPKKTGALIINSPSNPTGAVIPRKTLEEIADIAVENDFFVFSDEAYEKIIYEKKHFSVGSLNGMEDYVVTLQSFSKTYAMCGYRVGYACGPAEIIKAMTKMHPYTTISAPTISQMLATRALQIGSSFTRAMVREYRRRRNLISRRLNRMGLHTVRPDGAFYTFSNIGKYDSLSMHFSRKLMTGAKVAVMPGSEFGRFGEGYIRCSFATDYRLIEQAMDRIEKYLKKK